ncbi:FAD-dependent oxidoreductase [Aquimarina sp. ERC-38]|uniref:flavin monoamine oxidase family protein n=1 Tax=Aquimarina sp. ERC-38 TaxID=2949996 RepID=UPI0022467D8A|nr:FAD-dependent oxidoreductase [Aquimarina sp. ERC-38]UZO82316.1 FAD-dependent oxidoreductase [Aquimarina sp. ERC-38]
MTEQNTTKYVIVGAGLSGLTSAYFLNKLKETSFVILESRDRTGGRISTINGIDLGATWFQNHHQNVLNLLDDLDIEKFHQYSNGKSVLVYSSMAPAHYFENDPSTPSAYRISGGSSAMIRSLTAINREKIQTSTTVTAIKETATGVEVITDNGTYYANKVIITIPPRIATRITFNPELSDRTIKAMKTTHTWMSNAIKVGLTFKKPFWREKNLSGTLIGQVGAVTELYDHSNAEDNSYALMGFVNEALRDILPKERKEKILSHLVKYLGEEVFDYLTYQEKDWSQDKNTSCKRIKSIYMSPQYGNSVFSEDYMNGKLLFSGAETSPVYGGYMDGAIYSGIVAAQKLIGDY